MHYPLVPPRQGSQVAGGPVSAPRKSRNRLIVSVISGVIQVNVPLVRVMSNASLKVPLPRLPSCATILSLRRSSCSSIWEISGHQCRSTSWREGRTMPINDDSSLVALDRSEQTQSQGRLSRPGGSDQPDPLSRLDSSATYT